MKMPIVVNESEEMLKPGDLMVFSSAEDAETFLEPWYINESHFVFDGEGRRLKFILENDCLKLLSMEHQPHYQYVVRLYLIQILKSIADAKGWDYVGVTSEWCKSANLKELGHKSLKFATR